MDRPSRRNWIFVLLALSIGAALRLWFLRAYPVLDGDPLFYGDIAKNWLLHGIYGVSTDNGIHPTLIRLPGYPLFLAFCFRLFGVEHYDAVMYLQVVIDLWSCLLISAFARRTVGARAGMFALWLAALCPFTANFVASPLTETLSIFCVALALYALAVLIESPGPGPLLLLSFAFSYAALLRPDGALLGLALWPAILVHSRRGASSPTNLGAQTNSGAPFMAGTIAMSGLNQSPALTRNRALKYMAICAVLSLLPFAAWTIRNERTFHVFEPLAPRYAVDPGESPTPGFNRWMKTWCVEFTSTYEIYWNTDSGQMDAADLPNRAFDTNGQRQETAVLFAAWNSPAGLTPELDSRFAALAAERIRGHRLRYYVLLPVLRVADMGLRPRTENLPFELRWWQYSQHPSETAFCAGYAALNFAYLVAAVAGMLRWPRFAGAMLAFVLLRSLLLATLEAPETRYTLECFPMVIALAAAGLARRPAVASQLVGHASPPAH